MLNSFIKAALEIMNSLIPVPSCDTITHMPDLTATLLPRVQQHRLPGLDLGNEMIHPNYTGLSILNIPTSLCHFLGVPPLGDGPLAPEILLPLGEGYQRLILVLMDALALHRFQLWMQDSAWYELAQHGVLAPLTSVTPSTTSAALTSLWTGRSPAIHGITGYEMWLKEYGIVANTILHAPITYQNDVGSLTRAGFDPEKFLNLPTLGQHLAAHGIKPYAFQHHSIVHSGLSRMFFQDVTARSFSTAADLWVNLRQQIENRPRERMFASVYWGEVDGFSHRYGPDDERTAAEFASFSQVFERLFLGRLKPEFRRDTLVILTADHGQIATQPNPYFDLRNHPGLVRRLHLLPTGEHRLAYLYVRPGQIEAVREYIGRTWPSQFRILDTPYAVEAGLFGLGEPHPRLLDRLGDLIVIARGDAYLWWADKEDHMYGRHGGLHPEEMLVPFLAARL